MSYDFSGALKAGVAPKAILDEIETNPDAIDYDIKAARAAGVSDDSIVKELASGQPQTPNDQARDFLYRFVPGSIQRGYAHSVEGLANTADILGATETGASLHGAVNKEMLNAPTSQEAIGKAWHDGRYLDIAKNLPGAVGEAIPQLGAAVIGAGGGAALGTTVGGPAGGVVGLAAGAGADALAGIAFQAGDIAKARAKADGRETPNDSDIAAALGSSAVLGALDRVGLGRAAGGLVASAVKASLGREGAAGIAATSLGSVVAHGASDAAQSVGQQLAETAGTKQGATVDPDAVVAQGITGMGTRTALGAARKVADHVTGQAAADAAVRQADQDRTTWAGMDPEEQAWVQATAEAGKAIADIQDNVTGNVTPEVAARTAIAQRKDAINSLVMRLSGDDIGLLDSAQARTVREAARVAASPSLKLTPDHLEAVADLPLSPQDKQSVTSALRQMDALSDPASLQAVGGPISTAMGLAGDVASSAVHFKGLPGFLVRPAVNYLATTAGSVLDKAIGASQPRLKADANRAAAMLEANGLKVPDTVAGIGESIQSQQSAMQAMASVLGLNPNNYGPGAAERQAIHRVAAKSLGAAATPSANPADASPAITAAMLRAGMAPGTLQEPLQTPNGSTGVPVADKTTGASAGLPESQKAMSDMEPLMMTAKPDAQAMAQHLPRWMWVMGQKVQRDLQLSGMARNVNYSQEALQVLHQLHGDGLIDAPMLDGIRDYNGAFMPRGLFNLIRQRWLLSHGIDRRTLEAQQADPRE